MTALNKQAQSIISDIRLKRGSGDVYAPIIRWDEFEVITGALEAAENNLIDSECHVAELEESLRDKQALLETAEKRITDYHELISSLVGVSSSILREVERMNAAGISVEAE